MWEVKVKVIPVINGVLGTMAPKLEKWLQQISGTAPETTSIQKRALLGIAKVLTEPSISQASDRGLEVEHDQDHPHGVGKKLPYLFKKIFFYYFIFFLLLFCIFIHHLFIYFSKLISQPMRNLNPNQLTFWRNSSEIDLDKILSTETCPILRGVAEARY